MSRRREFRRAGRWQSRFGPAGYDAFLSYSHAVDGKLAPALQLCLHRLARPWNRLRALRVFRDQASLAASPSLWASIETALSSARFFILLASPEASDSKWVQREVTLWRQHRSTETFLIVLTDGDLVWNDTVGDFDHDRSTALPAPLHGWFETEPLWVDLRWARNEDQLSVRHSRFRNAVATLAAPIHGRSKDELEGEDVHQHRRATTLRRIAVSALSALLVATVVIGLVAVQQREDAQEQTRVALSRALAAESAAQDSLNPQLAVRLGLAAYSAQPTLQARANLMRLMDRNRHVATFLQPPLSRVPDTGARVRTLVLSQDSTLLALAYEGTREVVVWSTTLRQEVARINPTPEGVAGDSFSLWFSRDNSTLVINSGDRDFLWNLESGTVDALEIPPQYDVISAAPDSELVIISDQLTAISQQTYLIWDPIRNRPVTNQHAEPNAMPYEFTTDGKYMLYITRRPESGELGSLLEFRLFDRQQGAWVSGASVVVPVASQYAVSQDPTRLVTLNPSGFLETWDLHSGQRTAQRDIPRAANREVAVSADGKVILVSETGGSVVALDETLSRSAVVAQHPVGVRDITVSADGSMVYSVSDGGTVVQSAPLADRRLSVFHTAAPLIGNAADPEPSTGDSWIGELLSSPDGRQLLMRRGETVELWDMLTHERRLAVPITSTDFYKFSISFSPNGSRFGIRDDDRIRVWDSESLTEVSMERSPADNVAAEILLVGLLGGGTRLVQQSGEYDQRVTLHAVWSEGQKQLVTGKYNRIHVARRGSYVAVITNPPVDDDRQDARGTRIDIWRLAEHGPPEQVSHTEMQTLTATTAAVSSNGRFVVVADGNGLGEIFDLESSGTVTLAVGDARRVDGKFLFADQAGVLAEHVAPYDYGESDDGLFHNRVVLRDPDTGALLGEWDDPLGSPAQSHGYLTMELVGEDTLLTHRENGSVGIWRIGVEDWLRDLCALGGELTGAERQRYLVGVQIGSVCGA